MSDFPAFFYDSNMAFGKVTSLDDFNRFVEQIAEAEGRSIESARNVMLDATNMADPEARHWPEGRAGEIGRALEEWGKVPNFGYRIEHQGGTLTLREWLRVKGVLTEIEDAGPN